MFEKFNEAARRALFFARYESMRLGSQRITSEHLLLGILREGDAITKSLWSGFKLTPEKIRAKYPDAEAQAPPSAEVPLSKDAIAIMERAVEECDARNDLEVTPMHLVLAILHAPDCEAAVVLAEYDIEYDMVSEFFRVIREEIRRRALMDARTPLTLRQPHYEMLDRIAVSMRLRAQPHESRQRLILAIMDALAATGIGEQMFESPKDLEKQIRTALSEQWPRG